MRFLFAILGLAALANAFSGGFFDQMFGGGGEQQQQQQPQRRNNPSDASVYQHHYSQSSCDKFLCPDTLACVHFPHHCPCPWEANQEKFELAEGQRVCISKGGQGAAAARKIELARKGLL